MKNLISSFFKTVCGAITTTLKVLAAAIFFVSVIALGIVLATLKVLFIVAPVVIICYIAYRVILFIMPLL